MRRRSVLLPIALALVACGDRQDKGTLSQVAGGLSRAAGTSSPHVTTASPAGTPATGTGTGSTAGNILSAMVDAAFEGGIDWSGDSNPFPTAAATGSPAGLPTTVSVYAALQAVVGSTGSLTLDVSASHDRYGIGLRGTSFFEAQSDGTNLRLDLGTLTGKYRLFREGLLTGWVELGGAYVSTLDDTNLLGITGGFRISQMFGRGVGQIGLTADAHFYYMTDDVRAIELGAGFSLSVLRLSYRYLDFNIGPPLHGPEVGVAFTF